MLNPSAYNFIVFSRALGGIQIRLERWASAGQELYKHTRGVLMYQARRNRGGWGAGGLELPSNNCNTVACFLYNNAQNEIGNNGQPPKMNFVPTAL